MRDWLRSSLLLTRLALVGGLLLLSRSTSWAQCPTGISVSVVSPSNNATGLSGTVQVSVSYTALPPPDSEWAGSVSVNIEDLAGDLLEYGNVTPTGSATGYYNWNTTLYDPGSYRVVAEESLIDIPLPACHYYSTPITVTIGNPESSRHASSTKLQCSTCRDHHPTQSFTSPLSGNQGWTVPVTSWDYKGSSIPFALAYNSVTLKDPLAPDPPNFTGLSERNSHWTHPYAQWIDLYQDETGAEYAVWHNGNSYLSFPQSGTTTFASPDSDHTLTAAGSPVSTTYTCSAMNETTQVNFGYFIMRDAAGTKYYFDYTASGGQSNPYWQTGECLALPHYLLTQVVDRWGRTINVAWTSVSVNGGTEPRVASVMDAGDSSLSPVQSPRGVTLSYTNGLLTSIQDPQGRTHTLTYSAVADETGTNRQKLTGIKVYGAGSPNRVVYNWGFIYKISGDTNNVAYGGTYTGDLVVQKTEPDGFVVNYSYEPVTLPARPTPDDWDGRVSSITWLDGSEGGQTVQYGITRVKNSASQVTMTYPSTADLPVSVQENYAGSDLASEVDLATGRTWSYTYDSYHNALTVRSPLEQTTTNPLVQYQPTVDSTGHITQTVEQVLQDGTGNLGDPVTTLFNSLNLPTQITASSRDGQHDQMTQFQYDGGTLTKGSLTQIVEAAGTSIQQTTSLSYAAPDGPWGLPTSVQNEVGAVSSLTYDHPTGRLLTSVSPQNLLVSSSHPDRPSSVTTLQYNSDELPSLVQDPLGHQAAITYNAQGTSGSAASNLVVTTTSVNGTSTGDGSSRSVVLDPKGRILQATDENGVVTQWTYNPQGQVKSVTQAVGKPEQRVTLFNYDCRGDLYRIAPPSGGAGSVFFTYRRYTLDQNNNPVWDGTYEGQVTRIDYPDGTNEYYGYNTAGELSWHRKQDGGVVNIQRDALHRIKEIDYPASQGNAAFSVTTSYDEFGRAVSTSDNSGTTTVAFDQLDRPTSVTPPMPQAALTYSYSPDTTLQRWVTNVAAAGVGTYSYQEDTKGRLSDLVNPFSQTFHLEYDLDGKNTLLKHPNGVQEQRSYTARDWLAGIQINQQNGSTLDTLSYYYTDANNVYDPTGHLRREVDYGGRTHAFFYDNLYELTQETHPDFGTISYTWDPNGNRATRTTSAGTDYYGVDANNKLLWVNRGSNTAPTHNQANPYSLFTYDADGRTTYRERQFDGGWHHDFAFSWDGDDRLRSVTNGSTSWLSALYDGGGTRVSKTDLFTGTHNYSFGPGGVIGDSSGGTVYTPGFAHRQGSTDRFYHSDWLSSARYLTDGTGNTATIGMRYDAFGNRTATAGSDPYDPTEFQFAGGAGYGSEYANYTEVGIGLQYLDQRYYDPAIGRFVSPDPLGDASGSAAYSYCGGDPVNLADPSGMAPLYGQWHDYLASGLATGQAAVNNTLAGSGLGVAAATAINTVGELGVGILDLPAAIMHFPEQIAHWGEGSGEFAAHPSLATLPGVGRDLMTLANLGLLGEGGVRGLGKLARAVGERRAVTAASACEGPAALKPSLDIPARQLARKLASHGPRDWGLSNSSAANFRAFDVLIRRIWNGATEVRQGPWHPSGGGVDNAVFAIRGSDVVVAKPSGEFITVLRNALGNKWVRGAAPLH